MKSDIAIAASCWIRNPEEQKIVHSTIKHLSELNIPIVLTDAGSAEHDQKKIRQLPNIIFLEEKGGLLKQLITAHKAAANHGDYLFYLQTDKPDFAQHTAPKMIEVYRKLNEKGMLIPARTKKSLDSYPSYQKTQEEFLNYIISDYVGIKQDFYAGPKIYPASLIKYLEMLKGDLGWGIEAYFYAIAKRLEMPFDFIPCFIQAPIDIDNGKKTKFYRLKIVEWMIEALIQGDKVPL